MMCIVAPIMRATRNIIAAVKSFSVYLPIDPERLLLFDKHPALRNHMQIVFEEMSSWTALKM